MLILAVLLVTARAASSAAGGEDEERRKAPEPEVGLPAYPLPENLIPFVVSANSENRFLIDSESLTTDRDGIVRYTLVIISASGAENISYEGMNCTTAERRLYAMAHADRTWSRARSDRWMKIQMRDYSLNRYHATLFQEYFCPVGVPSQSPDEIRRALRSGGRSWVGGS
ncbi:CNP1-like family protein [Accumulibacter sp.]|uniref:CNP1-like family protein n=1 Tax=Accumulibacter sp. TaxID=2053492 RepID=UPI0025F592D5|nr:CNP1-like family protein [Accumulibacter sp.]MCM8594939.1 CNP1-like family protein [Accumulibacter sp.]MCM8625950.1 CNP1-like family protein [Accumulibacter sp.]MDS4049085.1 CNP1-like family protein [Accumulibacter sp.]